MLLRECALPPPPAPKTVINSLLLDNYQQVSHFSVNFHLLSIIRDENKRFCRYFVLQKSQCSLVGNFNYKFLNVPAITSNFCVIT